MLGVGISPINMTMAIERLNRWIMERASVYVSVSNVHSVMECQRDPRLRAIVNAAGMTTPDGMPLVWLARHHGHPHVSRVYGPDLMLAELQSSLKTGHRHFFYGGRAGVADRLKAAMEQRFPGISIVGTLSPPLGTAEELCTEETALTINRRQPDIVWVGVSSPKQEFWMACMRSKLEAPVLIGVGAAFDFHSGNVAQAPLWMQRSGLEWLFRLAREPRRLWRRYLIDNPWFLWKVTGQFAGWRRYPLN